MKKEYLLEENPDRFVLRPIQYPDIFDFYKKAESAFWTAEEVDLIEDIRHWEEKLSDDERYFISNVLQFFAASDGIVNENLALNFYNEVQLPEARAFYGFQIAIETIHSDAYAIMIETFVKDQETQLKFLRAMHHNPIVQKKASWALNWIKSESFVERLIAFVAVEGIFFAGSFCSIFWLKDRNLMPGLCSYNELISRDEGLHYEFACHLYKQHVMEKLPTEKIHEILLSALEIEKEFITDSLPVSLIGMNANLMKQYLEYVTDNILLLLGLEKMFNVENPFPFMAKIGLEHKTNFHEHRPTQYQKSSGGQNISFTEDF